MSESPDGFRGGANRRKTEVTAEQVLAEILVLQPPDPAAVLAGSLGVDSSEIRPSI
ncbi:MAG TPA: hypothetical protein VGQ50_00555 [Actinomycetota bacterium]|nr:hypothetical protein [Actinomycetota bacterium]